MRKIINKIDAFQSQNRDDHDEHLHMKLIDDIKQTEFIKTVNVINDVSYGNQRMINTLYNYKLKEQVEAIDIADEATKDFHDNKYNFMSNQRGAARKKQRKWLK